MANSSAQRLAALMKRVYDEQKVTRREDETDQDYFRRIRDRALEVQRRDRKAKRTASRAARKRNR